jgi:hypothetical protein
MRRSAHPVAPGEWLWFSQGACMLLSIALGSIFIPLFFTNPRTASPAVTYVAAYYVTTYLSAGLVFLLPAIRCTDGGPWKLLFWSAATLDAASAAIFAWMIVAAPTSLGPKSWPIMNLARHTIIATALIWAVVDERRRGANRPWTHWVGAIVMAVNLGVQFLTDAWTLHSMSA